MKKQKNQSLDIGKGLALLSQLAISIVTPPLLFVFGARYLTEKFNIGKWIVPVAIVLGVLVGLMSAWNLVQGMMNHQSKLQKMKEKEDGTDVIRDARERIATISNGDDKKKNVKNNKRDPNHP